VYQSADAGKSNRLVAAPPSDEMIASCDVGADDT
jgi:hypothetical protein